MVHSGVLYIFLSNGGASKRRGPRGSLPPHPTLSTGLNLYKIYGPSLQIFSSFGGHVTIVTAYPEYPILQPNSNLGCWSYPLEDAEM